MARSVKQHCVLYRLDSFVPDMVHCLLWFAIFKVIFTNNETFLVNKSRHTKVCQTLLMHWFIYFSLKRRLLGARTVASFSMQRSLAVYGSGTNTRTMTRLGVCVIGERLETAAQKTAVANNMMRFPAAVIIIMCGVVMVTVIVNGTKCHGKEAVQSMFNIIAGLTCAVIS